MPFLLHLLILLRLIVSPMAAADRMPMPSNFQDIKRIGCRCEQITEPPPQHTKRWHTKVFVEYNNGQEWQKLYSIREGNERKKALADCDRFMTRFYKQWKLVELQRTTLQRKGNQ